MSPFFRLCGAAAGVVTLAGLSIDPAVAQDSLPSAYVGLGGGFVFKNDQDFAGGFRATSDTGWGALGSVGYRWGNGLRTEFETAYRRNDGTFKDPILGTNTGGDVQSLDLMVNGLYDFHFDSLVPYAGVGIGAALNKYKFSGESPKSTNFAYQGIVGLTWQITQVFEAFVDYRYLATAGQEITLHGGTGDDQYKSHNVFFGIRWSFWSAAPPAVARQEPLPPPAAPVNWTVYFEYDKANVTQAAGAVLDEIKASTTSAQHVGVVGHTDTSGSPDYNRGLSERRAQNTASGLTTRGVNVGNVSGVGESDPAVPTPDGVKEPLNRRAVVILESPSQ